MFRREDALARAERFFDRGDVDQAAWILWEARRRALKANDGWTVAAIDSCSASMRERLDGDDRLPAFDAHLKGYESAAPDAELRAHPVSTEEKDADVSPLSLGIVLVGAGVMLISVFLPQFESNTFAQIEKNSLIQNGGGWWFIGIAVIAVGAAYHAYRARVRSYVPAIFGGIGIGVAFYYGTAHSQRELCSAASSFQSNCSLGTPGIGIYAAGVGGLLILIGGWQIVRSAPAELNEAEVAAAAAPAPPAQAPAPTIADRLGALSQLHADGVITDAEYTERRAALIEEV
jgi:hypothetical protein